MPLDKTKQQQLTHWLKSQGQAEKKWLRLTILLGTVSGFFLICQIWLFALILQKAIIDHVEKTALIPYFMAIIGCLLLRGVLNYFKEKTGFIYGMQIRRRIRQHVIDHLDSLGPFYIRKQPAGSWATLIVEQIESVHDFYARYLPQMILSGTIPLMIVIALLPINWAAALILLITAPLVPIFMILVGKGAAESSRRQFHALSHLGGQFLDHLRGLDTIRLFFQGKKEVSHMATSAEELRSRTMSVLQLAFLSSAVLEFFASLAIAVVAVYFGFFYLGELNFGSYGFIPALFAGFLALMLAPEFFQPLRDLGAFYHDKAQAISTAEALLHFINDAKLQSTPVSTTGTARIDLSEITLIATEFSPLTLAGQPITTPLNFTINNKQQVAIVGKSGAGKTSLINVLLGFLPYQGSLTVNGIEFEQLDLTYWRQQISWVGQNPIFQEKTIRENILLKQPDVPSERLDAVIKQAHIDEFICRLPFGLETEIGDDATHLSIGQQQRIAVARALISPCTLLLLDEPTASLDSESEQWVQRALDNAALQQTTLTISHKLSKTQKFDQIINVIPIR